MVLKQLQVTSLYELSLQVVSNKILKFIKEHYETCEFCSVCKTEQCSIIKPVIETLTLPEEIIKSVYDKVYLDQSLCLSGTMYHSNVNGHFLLLSLLKIEETSVKIKNFEFKRQDNDIAFILKFGKNINFLKLDLFQDNPEHAMVQQCVPRNQSNSDDSNAYDISASLYRLIFRSAINIQVLNLNPDIKVYDELFEVIGRECTQLKVLNHIRAGEDYATAKSFVKLLLYSNETGTHRNKCCDTLQGVHFVFCQFKMEHDSKMNEIYDVLLRNLPNLKSLGNCVYIQRYLELLKEGEIREAALDYICFPELTKRTATLLKVFCPTVKKLVAMNFESGVAENLSSLESLENIRVRGTGRIVALEIFSEHWYNLKVLKVEVYKVKDFINLDIDLVAKNFPLLTELSASVSRASWRGNTYFNCLKKVVFNVLDCNISWFASFASTVETVEIYCHNTTSPDHCKVFLTVPFPNLKNLCMDNFFYDFEFYSNVVAKLPKLEIFIFYGDEEVENEKAQHLKQLYQFLKNNNLQCQFEE